MPTGIVMCTIRRLPGLVAWQLDLLDCKLFSGLSPGEYTLEHPNIDYAVNIQLSSSLTVNDVIRSTWSSCYISQLITWIYTTASIPVLVSSAFALAIRPDPSVNDRQNAQTSWLRGECPIISSPSNPECRGLTQCQIQLIRYPRNPSGNNEPSSKSR